MPFRSIGSSSRFPGSCRVGLLAGAALCALTAAATAADRPATPEGAQKLTAFFATYMGAAPAGGPPALVVTPEGADYLVAIDLVAATAPLKAAGISYDPATLKFKLIEQDDGAWRIESADIPPISSHQPHGSSTMEMTGSKGVSVIDPATNWFRTTTGSADKLSVHVRTDVGVDETINAGALQVSGTGSAGADGSASSVFHESAADIGVSIVVTPKADDSGADPKTVTAGARIDKVVADINLDGLKTQSALALWAFLVAHPSRPDLAANEPALKTLANAAATSALKLNETINLQKIAVETPRGLIAIDTAKFGVGAAAGAPSSFEEHIAFDGLSLPATMVPPLYHDFTPTSADIGFKASGFDFAAASAEAIADLHLAGEAPPLSPDDRAKVSKKLLGAGPVTIDIPPSHIRAPRLDISFEGQIHYQAGHPFGAVTIHMRDFDNTVGALKALGPETERKLVTVIGMAKGLAKQSPDGALNWVAELGQDGMMKVNGLPLGKAPL